MDHKDRRDRQIKILVSQAELEGLMKGAGREPLAKYCRRLLVGELPDGFKAPVYDPPVNISLEQIRASAAQLTVPAALPKKGGPKLCPHGKRAKVDNCWQCGGLAKIEEK